MKSKYKYVYFSEPKGSYSFKWLAYVCRRDRAKDTNHIIKRKFETEIEAAKAVDLALIRNNEEPVNILKRNN